MPRRLLLAALAGFALSLAFEPVTLPVVLPLAPAGLALATYGLRVRAGLLVGLVFGVTFYYPHIWWMRESVGVDAWIALAAVEALFYGLLGGVTSLLQRHRLWPLWFAAAWATMELVRAEWPFSGMPWGRLAFGVIDTPVAEALPYVGATGVGFLLALLGALLVQLVRSRKRRWVPASLAGGVVVLTAVPLAVPWAEQDAARPHRQVTVAAVQGNVPGPGNNILWDHRQVTRNHVDATVDLAARVADGETPEPHFVLWPENSTAVDPFNDTETNAAIRAATTAIGVPVLVGAMVDAGEDHVRNQGIVWDPVTGPGDRYTKWHPVAYGEYIPFRRYMGDLTFGRLDEIRRDMIAGTRTEPLRIAGVDVANAICFDIAYEDVLHKQLRRGAELMTVQTSNAMFIFTDQIEQQFAITRVRAMEAGRWTVVSSPNGISGVIGPDGQVAARTQARTAEVLLQEVGLIRTVTPAVHLAPWLTGMFTCLSLLGLLLGTLAYRRSRKHSGSPSSLPDEATQHHSEARVGT